MSKPKIAVETVALIKEMARDNRLWGAERIRGELLKLGIHVCLPNHSKVHEACSLTAKRRTDMGYFPAEPCARHMGV